MTKTRHIFKRDSDGRWYLQIGKQVMRHIGRDYMISLSPQSELVYEYDGSVYSDSRPEPIHPFQTGLPLLMEMDPRGSIDLDNPRRAGCRVEVGYGGYGFDKKVQMDPTPIYAELGFLEYLPE